MKSPGAAMNHWPESACAKAFWGQRLLPPYRQLLKDTAGWLQPKPGERWLDLGCGSGQMSKVLWQRSGGALAEVVGLDCAAINGEAFAKLRANLQPPPPPNAFSFVVGDFSHGLAAWPEGRFHGIVSGLAIQYAESYSERERRWTSAAYDSVLVEAHRLLQPGGRFVFSVNVPEPAWGRLALPSLREAFRHRNPARYLLKAYRMWCYGGWLKREARAGRFHYLPAAKVHAKLRAAGFVHVEHRLSYASLAYLFRAYKAESGIHAA